MSAFPHAHYLKGAHEPPQFVTDTGAEVCFGGRSNAGKSSAINAITQRAGLARTSKTPGHTQLVNFFELEPGRRLVDLPGYGFAKVPKGGRAFFQQLVADYIQDRDNLRCLFVLIDSRLEPQRIDLEFLEWLAETGRAFDLVFTKTDKLKPAKIEKNIVAFVEAIAPCRPEFHRSSALDGSGRQEILGRVGYFLRD